MQTPAPEFREKVLAAIGQNKSWVVDGNYDTRLGSIIDDEATDVICKFLFYFVARLHFALAPLTVLFLARVVFPGYFCFYDVVWSSLDFLLISTFVSV